MLTVHTKSELKQLIASKPLILLQFSSGACAPCRAISEKLCRWGRKHPLTTIISVSLDQVPSLAVEYSIFSVPALLLFTEGKLSLRKAGYFSLEEFLEKSDRYEKLIFSST